MAHGNVRIIRYRSFVYGWIGKKNKLSSEYKDVRYILDVPIQSFASKSFVYFNDDLYSELVKLQ